MKLLVYQDGDDVTILTGEGIHPAFGVTDPGDPILRVTGTVEIIDAALTLPDNFRLHTLGPNPSLLQRTVWWLAGLVLPSIPPVRTVPS